jgi:voltage-gated potassium channel
MLRDKDKNLRLEEIPIVGASTFVGIALKDAPIRRETGALVVAIRRPDRTFVYNPDPDLLMEAGTTLIVLGESQSIVKLRTLVTS